MVVDNAAQIGLWLPDSAFPGELRNLADAAALEPALAGLAEEYFDGLVNNVGSVHPAALDDAEWASLEAP